MTKRSDYELQCALRMVRAFQIRRRPGVGWSPLTVSRDHLAWWVVGCVLAGALFVGAAGPGDVSLRVMLERTRSIYLEALRSEVDQLRRAGVTLAVEAAIRNPDGRAARDGELQTPVRIDVIVIEDGAFAEERMVDSDRALKFETAPFTWNDSMEVRLTPFQWDWCQIRFDEKKVTSWRPLRLWYQKWFDEVSRARNGDEFLGVVHFLSDPIPGPAGVTLSIDLGTAPIEAFTDLLYALSRLGLNAVEIGQFPDSEAQE